MSQHKGPYTVKFVSKDGREHVFTRKTFKDAETVANEMFDRSRMASIRIANVNGHVFSPFNKES